MACCVYFAIVFQLAMKASCFKYLCRLTLKHKKVIVKILLTSLSLGAALTLGAADANAAEVIAIEQTDQAPLFDGRCGSEEWKLATKIELPAQVAVYLMHDRNSLFVCAKGKAEDYTVIDLYIEDAETGHFHTPHASAQLGQRLRTDKEWSETKFWELEDWSGFWVPYAGNEETEEGVRTKFLEGSHREIQVLRKKFVGNSWKMMIEVSGVHHEGKYGAQFIYPDNAVDIDESTWGTFSFSNSKSVRD